MHAENSPLARESAALAGKRERGRERGYDLARQKTNKTDSVAAAVVRRRRVSVVVARIDSRRLSDVGCISPPGTIYTSARARLTRFPESYRANDIPYMYRGPGVWQKLRDLSL